MKLKNLKKLCNGVRYCIKVFDGDRFIEDFRFDYVDMSNDELKVILCNKYFKYENCKVKSFGSEIWHGNAVTEISIQL